MVLNGEKVEMFPDARVLNLAAAERIALLAENAVEDHEVFTIALSGGSTPRALYQLMATDEGIRSRMPWPKIHFFFSDERHVSPEHVESNFRMANEAMFQALGRNRRLNIHRVLGEITDASEAAALYEEDLWAFFKPHGLLTDGLPRFDLILLGMGPDGHTASLFPNSLGLFETSQWVVANWVEKFKANRITMTFPVINAAAEVIMLVSGPEKAPVLAKALDPATQETNYPVQRVRLRGGIKRWMIDASAAANLNRIPVE